MGLLSTVYQGLSLGVKVRCTQGSVSIALFADLAPVLVEKEEQATAGVCIWCMGTAKNILIISDILSLY